MTIPSDTAAIPAGVVSALLTPMTVRGQVDAGALGNLVDFQVEHGVDGFLVLGTSGEGLLMDTAARRDAAEHARAVIGDRAGCIIHCGAADLATTTHLVRHAAQLNPSAIAAMPPLVFSDDIGAYATFYESVAHHAAGCPVLAYDNPGRFGFTMGPAVLGPLIEAIPTLVGVKDSGDSLARITDHLAHSPGIVAYTGSNVLLLGALAVGAAGAVASLANIAPELLTSVRNHFHCGDLPAARRDQLRIARLQRVVSGLPYVASLKALACIRGLPSGVCHPPLMNDLDAVVAELRLRIERDAELRQLLTRVE